LVHVFNLVYVDGTLLDENVGLDQI